MISGLLHLILSVFPLGGSPSLPNDCSGVPGGRVVPTLFAGGRVFALWHLDNGRELRLYTDTGGGTVSLYPTAVRRMGVSVDTTHWTRGTVSSTMLVAKIPVRDGEPAFPPIPIRDSVSFTFLVEDQRPPEDEAGISWDGRLGAIWFVGGVWSFDYPSEKLLFNGSAPTGPPDPACWVPLGFQTDSTGRRTNIFPRIEATIDGERIQFLLDTGARTEVTRDAWPQIQPNAPRHRSTSFIGTTLFQKWRAKHPDWSQRRPRRADIATGRRYSKTTSASPSASKRTTQRSPGLRKSIPVQLPVVTI